LRHKVYQVFTNAVGFGNAQPWAGPTQILELLWRISWLRPLSKKAWFGPRRAVILLYL
jgi:phage-related protein